MPLSRMCSPGIVRPITSGPKWYVDNAVGISGNGQSWATAWKNFSNIVWTSIAPGSILYISGGSTSKTYNEMLVVDANGTAGNPITITKGVDSGHDGTVIIDGQNTRTKGVDIGQEGDGTDHIVLRGIEARNCPGIACFYARYSTGGLVIENCHAHAGSAASGGARGFDIRWNVGVIVRNCTCTTPTSTPAQTDCFYSMGNDAFLYEGNHLVRNNTDSTGHSDVFQSYQDLSGTIRNNFFQGIGGGDDNHGLWIEEILTGSNIYFYNNICYNHNDTYNLGYYRSSDAVGNGVLHILNNTFYGGWSSMHLNRVPDVVVKNNIIHTGTSTWTGIEITNVTPTSTANFTNNLILAPSAAVARILGSTRTYAQFTSAGYNASGVNADPQFADFASGDFHLQSTSPARDAGVTLAAVETDKDGVPRPQGSAYDIGAYEYVP